MQLKLKCGAASATPESVSVHALLHDPAYIVLTPKEVARIIRYCPRHVTDLVKEGKLEPVGPKSGRGMRILRSSVLKWLGMPVPAND